MFSSVSLAIMVSESAQPAST